MKRTLATLALVVLVAACGGSAATATSTAKPAAFDVNAVKTSFRETCADPELIEDFCTQVQIESMTADGDILYVPTTLTADAGDQAETFCNMFSFQHFDANAADLGYKFVGILDKDGGNAAACTVG